MKTWSSPIIWLFSEVNLTQLCVSFECLGGKVDVSIEHLMCQQTSDFLKTEDILVIPNC